MAKKDEEYVSYTEAVRGVEQEKHAVEPLFTEEELKKLEPHPKDLKSKKRTEARRPPKVSVWQKDVSTPVGIVFGFIGLLFFINLFFGDEPTPDYSNTNAASPPATPTPAISTKQEKINRQFSAWDGSHRDLVRRTKAAMHDPSSFEHISTRHVEKDGYLMVVMEYRGKNGFGAIVRDEELAFYKLDGEYMGNITP